MFEKKKNNNILQIKKGVPKNSEFQWRSTLRKIEPMKPFISNYTKKEMTGLPERRILKTAEISQPNRNPLLADANLVSTNHFHCGPQVDFFKTNKIILYF